MTDTNETTKSHESIQSDASEALRGRIPLLSIVIPAYNEEMWIGRLLDRLFEVELPCRREVIVIDDGSKDRTREIVMQYADKGLLRYACLAKNSGKGAALRAGFDLCTGDYVLVQDADEEYDPRDIPELVRPLMEGKAKVVYGSRVINEHLRGQRRWTNPFWYGGRSLTWMANLMFFKCRISDEAVCYKLFRRDVLAKMPMRCMRFEFCPEVTAKISRLGIPIHNVAINYHPRSVAAGKKIRSKDWFEAVAALLRYRFTSDHGPVASFHPRMPDLQADSGPHTPQEKGHTIVAGEAVAAEG